MEVKGISLYSNRRNLNFQRRLRENEKPEYQKTLKDAYDFLGVKNVAMIIHGTSFPSVNRDIGVGSPYSKGAQKLMDLEQLHGFNSTQLGPVGKISRADVSPYKSKVFAKNHLFINLEDLKTEKYAKILSDKTYNLITSKPENAGKNYGYANFQEAFENMDVATKEAFDNFNKKVKVGEPAALKLNKEYVDFKARSEKWLEKDGMFKVLANIHGTEDFNKWENQVDVNLVEGVKKNDKKSVERYNLLKERSKDKIERNSFVQFLADKQLKENVQLRKEKGIGYINDLLAGFSKSDEWANKDAFLDDWRMGCPSGGDKFGGLQAWDMPVLDPKKLFKEDGTLGKSGQLLKEKIEASVKDYENIRVDHALGIVDPYVYSERSLETGHPTGGNISYMHGIDPDHNFLKILDKIVIPTLKENGVDPKQAVWEDLVCDTPAFNKVYHEDNKLPGITQTEWRRIENSPKDNWALVGSHDSIPAQKMIEREWTQKDNAWNVNYLAGFLNPDPKRATERNDFCKKISDSPAERVKAKFVELFRGPKNIQISFADFFGIDKAYNEGGKNLKNNWKLRVSNDFEDQYYKNLESDKPTAINMPEILKMAVQAKRDMLVVKSGNGRNSQAAQNAFDKKAQPLMSRLDKFEKILKEKED